MLKQLLRSKYKVFRFISLLYYGIFFLVGYLLGSGQDKIINFIMQMVRS